MSFFTAERFAKRYGREELLRFAEYLKDGCPDCRHKRSKCKLEHVAMIFHLSVSEVCALRGKLLVRRWENSEGLEMWLKLQEEYLNDKKAVILELKNDRFQNRA